MTSPSGEKPNARHNRDGGEAHVEGRSDEVGDGDEAEAADHRDESTLFFAVDGEADTDTAPDQRRK